jgi:hypothetical protein
MLDSQRGDRGGTDRKGDEGGGSLKKSHHSVDLYIQNQPFQEWLLLIPEAAAVRSFGVSTGMISADG